MTLLDFSEISIGREGVFEPCPIWYSAFVNFAAEISMDTAVNKDQQFLSVLSVPRIDGVTTALAIGSLYGEVYKLRNKVTSQRISVDELQLGMQVSILCGTGGHQAVGEVTKLEISDRTPKVTVGNVVVAIKSIREINVLSDEIGKPKQFKKMEVSSDSKSETLFGVLADRNFPIFRSLLMLRATTGITEKEFSIEFRDETTGQVIAVRDLLNPIHASSKDIGTTLVLNTNEQEQLDWLTQRMQLSAVEASPQILVMGSAPAILSQIENIGEHKVIAVIGRNERQITAAVEAVRTAFAYSVEVSRRNYWDLLPKNTELVTFARSL
jgi:hypothetical protein